MAHKWIGEGGAVKFLEWPLEEKELFNVYYTRRGRRDYLVVIEPSPFRIYIGGEPPAGQPKWAVAGLVKTALEYAERYQVPTLIVLTDVEYEALRAEYEKSKEEPPGTAIDVAQFDREFYKQLVVEYGGGRARQLSPDVLEDLAGKVVEYKGATALVAKHVGLVLREGGLEEAKTLLRKGADDVKAFFKLFVERWLGLRDDNYEMVDDPAIDRWRVTVGKVLALRTSRGRLQVFQLAYRRGWRYFSTSSLMSYLLEWAGESNEEKRKRPAQLLSRLNEELVEEALLHVREEQGLAEDENWLGEVVNKFTDLVRRRCPNAAVLGAVLLGYDYVEPFIGEGECDLDLLAVDGKVPPLVAALIHQAAVSERPLTDPQKACQSLPDAIKENAPLDAAVRAAYAYAALTQSRDNGCVEKALYALDRSILHIGPFADVAIDTALEALGRVGAVEGAPQVLRTILNRHGLRPGVCEGAKSLLGELYRGAEGRSWTYRAYLAEAFAETASKCGLEEAARVAEKLLGELGEEERLLASGAYYSLAQWLRARGELDEAERYAELLGKAADRLAGAARGGADRRFWEKAAQYLKWRSLKQPEEALAVFAESLRVLAAELRGNISLEKYVLGLEERPDAEAFTEAADMSKRLYEAYKSPSDFINYLIARGLYGRALFLSGEYGRALQVLEETWEEASKGLRPDARYLEVAALSLVHYAAALIHGDCVKKAEEMLREHGPLLLFSPSGWATFYLYARALGVEAEELSYLEDAILGEVYDAFKPAMHRLLTGQSSGEGCEEACDVGDDTCREWCVTALATASGNVHAAEEMKAAVTSAIDKIYEKGVLHAGSSHVPLREVLNRFGVAKGDYGIFKELGGRELVEVWAPISTFGWMLLLFKAASEGNLRLAKAHALRGALEAPRLFAEVYNALKGVSTVEGARGKPEYKTALTKLLLYHI